MKLLYLLENVIYSGVVYVRDEWDSAKGKGYCFSEIMLTFAYDLNMIDRSSYRNGKY